MATAKRSAKKKAAAGSMAGYAQVDAPSVATRKVISPAKQVLESIRVEVAANGFTVSCSHSGPLGEYISTSSRKPMVFADVNAALAYIGEQMRAAKGVAKAPKAKRAAAPMASDNDGDEA